jgi:hypothetical protein
MAQSDMMVRRAREHDSMHALLAAFDRAVKGALYDRVEAGIGSDQALQRVQGAAPFA